MPLSRWTCFLILFSFLIMNCPATSERQATQMVDSILGATETQLESAEAKITYVGPQEKPIPTVVFSSKGYELSLDRFTEIQYKHKHYANDDNSNVIRFSVTPAEFRRMLLAVKPIVTKVSAEARPEFLSFAVIREEHGQFYGEEFVIGRAPGRAFYDSLCASLDRHNEYGRRTLSRHRVYILPGH